MSKAKITKLFISSVIACITGAILVVIAWSAFPRNVFVMNGSDIVAVHGSTSASAMFGLGAAGAVILVGAAIAAFASWIGALLNTATLDRKLWFIAIALLGVFNCGLLAVFAYVVAGPDRAPQTAIASTLAPAARYSIAASSKV
jgi:hypothetical protein